MATQPQAKKTKGGNVKEKLKTSQFPTGVNSVESNTIPQLAKWRKEHPPRLLVWEKG
jgi:hypothetical protein